jgi:hypothetical protein
MSWFVVLDPHISDTEVYLILLSALTFVSMVITAIVFTIRDSIKSKFGFGLAFYWGLLAITLYLFFGLKDNSDSWDTPRIVMTFVTIIYFIGHIAYRVIRKRKRKSAEIKTNE